MFPESSLSSGTILAWIVVGLPTGWIFARLMKLKTFGQMGYAIVGLIGALLGGLAYEFVEKREAAFWGSLVAAFIGADLLIALFRFMGFKRHDK